ncbi:MAG: hypothetical protein ACI8UX_001305 [Psychromonas sp.]|jgi:hypothetical protein
MFKRTSLDTKLRPTEIAKIIPAIRTLRLIFKKLALMPAWLISTIKVAIKRNKKTLHQFKGGNLKRKMGTYYKFYYTFSDK